MVWIHGGGNVIGSKDWYDFSRLVARENVIVVTVNYRLGPLGWFTHPAIQGAQQGLDASSNFGTLDIIRALEWERDNIGEFGASKNNITIIDTAGLRETSDNIELQGIEITKKSISSASMILYVVDDSVGFDEEDERLIAENSIDTCWVINNKIDITEAKPNITVREGKTFFNVSTLSGLGMDNLTNKRSENSIPDDETTGTARLRHLEHLSSSLDNLLIARDCNNNQQLELVAEELRLAHASFVAIMGVYVNEDLLDKIFSDFCRDGDSETDYSGISKKIGGDAWDYPFDPKGTD